MRRLTTLILQGKLSYRRYSAGQLSLRG